MRNLNLDQLQALVEVVELGSISAAAKRLNLTQPAVSLQIRELEGRLGMPLLRRAGQDASHSDIGRPRARRPRQGHFRHHPPCAHGGSPSQGRKPRPGANRVG